MQRLNLLSCLIADGILDIRIAYTEGKNGIGMYHEKMGVIEDDEGNAVAFSGSMNESATAMSINYETIDVFRSWGDENESDRVRLKQNAFCSIWNDGEPNIRVLSFPSISQALIEKYKKSPPNFNIDREQFPPEGKNTRIIRDGSVHLTTTAVGPRIPQMYACMTIRKKLSHHGSAKTIMAFLIWQQEQENIHRTRGNLKIVGRSE